VTNYYIIIKEILEYRFFGVKEIKVVFFDCDWLSWNMRKLMWHGGIKHEEGICGHNSLYYMPYPGV
jgi:hypothetical protein